MSSKTGILHILVGTYDLLNFGEAIPFRVLDRPLYPLMCKLHSALARVSAPEIEWSPFQARESLAHALDRDDKHRGDQGPDCQQHKERQEAVQETQSQARYHRR